MAAGHPFPDTFGTSSPGDRGKGPCRNASCPTVTPTLTAPASATRSGSATCRPSPTVDTSAREVCSCYLWGRFGYKGSVVICPTTDLAGSTAPTLPPQDLQFVVIDQ